MLAGRVSVRESERESERALRVLVLQAPKPSSHVNPVDWKGGRTKAADQAGAWHCPKPCLQLTGLGGGC